MSGMLSQTSPITGPRVQIGRAVAGDADAIRGGRDEAVRAEEADEGVGEDDRRDEEREDRQGPGRGDQPAVREAQVERERAGR